MYSQPMYIMPNTQRLEKIKTALEKLNPEHLEVIDESYKHIGHEGAKSGKGHFKVIIASKAFEEKNRIQSHQLIYTTLGELMETEIHALSIQIL